MTPAIYITEESLPWLLEAHDSELRGILMRLADDSKILLMSLIAHHYKEALIPEDLSPLLRESTSAGKFHNLFMVVARHLNSRQLHDLCQQQPDPDKQSLFISALAQKVNAGDPSAFRYLCEVAEMPQRLDELRYSALTSLRMLPDEKIPRLRKVAQRTLNHILSNRGSSRELKHTARSILQHMAGPSSYRHMGGQPHSGV